MFDFDGTLVDSFPSLYIVFKRAFEAINIEIDPNDIPWMSRVPLLDSYNKYNAPDNEESIQIFSDAILEALDSREALELTRLFDDSRKFFDYIKENHIKCGIVTSNQRKHVQEVLDFFNIDSSIFEVIVGNETCKTFKPSPEPILKALELLDYKDDLKDIVYIGDSHNDCLSAINANISYYLLDRGDAPSKDYPTIYSLMDLFNK